MNDERRAEDRRDEDVRLADELHQIPGELAQLRADLSQLADKEHGHPEIYRLIEALEGRSHMMPSGRVHYEGGLINEVAQLTKAMRNGGFKIKIPAAGWVAIIVAILAGLFNVWAAVVAGVS